MRHNGLGPIGVAPKTELYAVKVLGSTGSGSWSAVVDDVAAAHAAGVLVVSAGTCALCDPTGYKSLSGTSMATPHVSGVGALLMLRGWNNVDAWSLINGTARNLGDPGFDELYRLRPGERPRRGGRDASAAPAAAERRDAADRVHHEPGRRGDSGSASPGEPIRGSRRGGGCAST